MADGGVLFVSLGSTVGLRASDREMVASLRRAGARVEVAVARAPRPVRTLALTDLSWALSARRAALEHLAGRRPAAIVYSTTTAALLWPRPGAIRLDAGSAANRPGRHGFWQRPLERRRLAQAPVLVPTDAGALAELSHPLAGAVVVPIPVTASGPGDGRRDIDAITYAANPAKKGLDRVIDAWGRVRREGETLVVAGAAEQQVRARVAGKLADHGIRAVGTLGAADYRALLRRARVYVTAPRREDYGLAQLEALADGCVLVSTPAPGPYPALRLARELDPRSVSEDLAAAIRSALDDPRPGYGARAARALAPFAPAAVDRRVSGELVPRLLGTSGALAGD